MARKNNPKRAFGVAPGPEARARLACTAKYVGSPYHKRNPGDFGLTPPALPRPDKTLCDECALFAKAEAAELLANGLCRGMVSGTSAGKWPKNVWSVGADGCVFEAQGDRNGEYHGYPLLPADAFREKVIEEWELRDPCGHRICRICGNPEEMP